MKKKTKIYPKYPKTKTKKQGGGIPPFSGILPEYQENSGKLRKAQPGSGFPSAQVSTTVRMASSA